MSKFFIVCHDQLESHEYEVLHLPALPRNASGSVVGDYGFINELFNQEQTVLAEFETENLIEVLQ